MRVTFIIVLVNLKISHSLGVHLMLWFCCDDLHILCDVFSGCKVKINDLVVIPVDL